eukprot:Gb_16448 [translate_table: standard]
MAYLVSPQSYPFSSFAMPPASAITTVELASSFHHSWYKYKFKNCKHIRFFGNVDAEFIQQGTLTTAAVQEKTMWKLQGDSFNSAKEASIQGGISVDLHTYASILQACISMKALTQVHARILTTGLEQTIFLQTKLVSMYAMYGSMEYARLVFEKICKPNVSLWNLMIRWYAKDGPCEEALALYYQMLREGIQPDNFTFPFVLKACGRLSALPKGEEIHDHIIRSGFESDVFVGNSLVAMYAKCGSMDCAREVFDKMLKTDVVSWNTIIVGYIQNGYAHEALTLFKQMQLADMTPNLVTMVSAIQSCAHLGALKQGKWIHDYIISSGFESDVFVGSALVAMYTKCRSIEAARQVFDKMTDRDVVSWNTMIDGYVQNGHANEALALFNQMELAEVKPDSVTLLSVVQACTHSLALQPYDWIHAYLIKTGFELDATVRTALIDMYAKCGSIKIACQLFDRMSIRNVVSWSVMIAGYTQNGQANEALTLFYQMLLADMKPDSATMLSVLSACAQIGALQQSKAIHGYTIKSDFELDVVLETNLLDMYAKCGSVEIACQLFEKMSERDVVSWNTFISGYTHNGHANNALALLHQMQLVGMKPDSITMVSVLPACAHLASLQQCKRIHGYIIRSGLESDVFVRNSLIDTYAKCGSIGSARQVFDGISVKDVVSWNVIIAGYGMHGHGDDAVALFLQMQQTGMKPNHITFVCVLSACSHAGLVDEGWQYFESMTRDFCITPKVEHYACMVDLLGRAGHLDEAQDFIEKMPLEPNASVWGALLAACRIYCNIELGVRVAEHLFDIEPKNVGCYVLLSNIYAAASRWDDVTKLRTMMKDKGVKKTPGCSLIEVNNKVHVFLVGDRSHPQSEKIYATLEMLAGQMAAAGYVPDTNFVLHDVEEEVKEHMLSSHSEKLAIAFGLINISPGFPIHITKNLRVCGDCHNATKFISKVVGREIILRDANRFHHFKDGSCSCRDYW